MTTSDEILWERACSRTGRGWSSSAATLPTNIAISEQSLGVPPKIAGFVLPLGNTMCMNGTALFEGITVMFLAGLPLSVIDRAKTGTYTQFEIQRGLGIQQTIRWFEEAEGGWRAVEDLRRPVRFQETLIRLPDTTRMKAVARIQEAQASAYHVLRELVA